MYDRHRNWLTGSECTLGKRHTEARLQPLSPQPLFVLPPLASIQSTQQDFPQFPHL